MVHIARWKKILVIGLCVLGVLYALPNVMGQGARTYIDEKMPAVFPSKTVNLGLDLQGGSHLLSVIKLSANQLKLFAAVLMKQERVNQPFSAKAMTVSWCSYRV